MDVKLPVRNVTIIRILSLRALKNQVIPPFQIGFMDQLPHEHCRSLIETLHAYGMCRSYDELR